MDDHKAVRDRLILLVCIGFLFVNYPLLSLFSSGEAVLGIPMTYLYLFAGWAIFIGAIGIVMVQEGLRSRSEGQRRDGTHQG